MQVQGIIQEISKGLKKSTNQILSLVILLITKGLVLDYFLNYQLLTFMSGGKPLQHCYLKRAILATELQLLEKF